MLEIVFAVLAKARMKRETKQAVGPALIEDLLRHIGEQGFRFLGRVLFEQPDFPGLMHDKKRVADSRKLAEPHQAGAYIPRLLNKRMRKPHFLVEEWPHRDGLRDLPNLVGHAAIAHERGLRLFQRDQILDEIRELLPGHSALQPFRHERNGAAALLLDVARRDADPFPVRAHQFERFHRGLLEDALKLLAGFGFHDGRAIADRDGRRRLQHRADQFASRKSVSDRKQIRPRLAAAAIDRMTLRARRPLLGKEKFPPARSTAVVSHREFTILVELPRRVALRSRGRRLDGASREDQGESQAGSWRHFDAHDGYVRFTGYARGVSSYQPGATRYERGRWPAMKIHCHPPGREGR